MEETADQAHPTLSPRVLTAEKDLLERAVEKWLKFQTSLWEQVNMKLEGQIRTGYVWSVGFRVTAIVLSSLVTTMSGIGGIPVVLVTIAAGTLTAITGVEAFLKYSERQAEARKQQREIAALRDRLRFEWFVAVEVEPNMDKRLEAAKRLLVDGPKAYNDILDKYSSGKGEKGQAPTVNT